jgi:hypothetical protein
MMSLLASENSRRGGLKDQEKDQSKDAQETSLRRQRTHEQTCGADRAVMRAVGTAGKRRSGVARRPAEERSHRKIHATLFGRLDSADPAAIVERVARLEAKLKALMESRELLLRAGYLEIDPIKRSARRGQRSLELLPR